MWSPFDSSELHTVLPLARRFPALRRLNAVCSIEVAGIYQLSRLPPPLLSTLANMVQTLSLRALSPNNTFMATGQSVRATRTRSRPRPPHH
jgi:hypothetical protein